jgi:arylsulfatase A-like enzyme
MTIPWFLAGPGISAGEIPEQVRIFDTAPTLAAALGLPPLREWDGVSRIPSR